MNLDAAPWRSDFKWRWAGAGLAWPELRAVHSRALAVRTGIPRLRSKSEANSQKTAHNTVAKVIKPSPGIENQATMKAKHLCLALAALLAAGGLWLARSAWRTPALPKSSMGAGSKTPLGAKMDPNSAFPLSGASQTGPTLGFDPRPKPGLRLQSPAPPTPNRRFTDFTPEQRVQFARQGHGPGG